MNKIDKTLKQIAAGTPKANSESSSSTEPSSRSSNLPGDPNCPICRGIGFVRQDLPVGHPDFGRMQVCVCRQKAVQQAVLDQLYRLSSLQTVQHLTFETFNTQGRVGLSEDQIRSLQLAHNGAHYFAQNLKGWLLLMGPCGCGKTHLAAAIANFVVGLGVPTLFLTVPDLLDWLRFAYDDPDVTFEQRFEEIRNIQLLVLDDFGTQNATPWAQEKLFQILNYRYLQRLPVVVTTNQELNEIEERLRSRLQDPDLVSKIKITAPDYRSPAHDGSSLQLSTLELHQSRTFSSFSLRENESLKPDERKTLETAFAAARKFAENPRGWLVFSGSYGCGKTHLAAAIGNHRASQGEKPMFVVVPDLLDHLRATFNPASAISYDRLFDEVRTVPLLILDDLGTQSATPWAREKLYQLFNYRYVAELPTVITTSAPNDIDPRLTSRMLDERMCRLIAILAPSYRGAPASKPKRGRGGVASPRS